MRRAIDHVVAPVLELHPDMALSIGVIADGEPVLYGHGEFRASPSTPPAEADERTLFEIGSITKVFTAALLADLVAAGRVRLEEPVGELLGLPSFPPDATLLRLATHTAGLPRLPRNLFQGGRADLGNPYAHYTTEHLMEYLRSVPPRPLRVGALEYSDLGMGLLGQALAQRIGMSFEQAMVEHLCRPLGLHDTRITLTPEQRSRLAPPRSSSGQPVSAWEATALAGAGALRSTVHDLLLFLATHLGLRPSPKAAVLRACQTIYVNDPVLSRPLARPERLCAMALGWAVAEFDGSLGVPHKVYWHTGGTGGYQSFIGFVRESSTGVVVLSNCGPG
ncbi:MAG TPA: serine hydrolase domain-containing protein, partial [Polyangia bacterium]|nr:serine hydrolase domain-containing protein [Polyangia bacterium]